MVALPDGSVVWKAGNNMKFPNKTKPDNLSKEMIKHNQTTATSSLEPLPQRSDQIKVFSYMIPFQKLSIYYHTIYENKIS